MRLGPTVLAILLATGVARADQVFLTNGNVIDNVRVTLEEDGYRLRRDKGSSVVPADEVARIVAAPTSRELLADKKLAAGDDPARIRALAAWCEKNQLPDEKTDLLALARGIELDRKLDALRTEKKAEPFVALLRVMKCDGGYSDAEKKLVLDLAFQRDPDNAQVRAEMGQVQRDGRWVSIAEASEIDSARYAQTMCGLGYIQFEGEWVKPERKAQILAEREKAAADAAAAAPTPAPVVVTPPADDTGSAPTVVYVNTTPTEYVYGPGYYVLRPAERRLEERRAEERRDQHAAPAPRSAPVVTHSAPSHGVSWSGSTSGHTSSSTAFTSSTGGHR
jgi:hypothetical protein